MEGSRIGEALDSYIRPQTFPVAVKMVRSGEEVPDKVRMPKRDLGTPMALCQGLALARRHGWPVAMGLEDMVCPLGAVTLGLVPAKDRFLDGSFNIPFWVKDQGVRAKMARALPQLEVGKYSHVVAAPLHRAGFEPDVIVVYGNAAQVGRLIQAAVYGTGEPVVSSSVGGFACGLEITQPMLTGECQFVVVGGGDRAIAQAHDHEIAFAMPVSRAEAVAEGLEGTHKAGMRYPTTPYLMYAPLFPPAFGELMDYLKEGG
jgi:uncharacterized protein (DUF169 family)